MRLHVEKKVFSNMYYFPAASKKFLPGDDQRRRTLQRFKNLAK
jgi:hypothetical protein